MVTRFQRFMLLLPVSKLILRSLWPLLRSDIFCHRNKRPLRGA